MYTCTSRYRLHSPLTNCHDLTALIIEHGKIIPIGNEAKFLEDLNITSHSTQMHLESSNYEGTAMLSRIMMKCS